MRYMNFASAAPWTALANLLTLQGQPTEDYDIILGEKLHCMLVRREDTGAYVTGSSLLGSEWYNLYLKPRGWAYMEFTYTREDMLDYLWPLTMLRFQVHASMPTDAIFLGDVDGVYTFMPSGYASEGDAQIELSREELLAHLPEQATLGSIRRCEAEEVDFEPLLAQSSSNWFSLREAVCAFMQEEHTAVGLRDGLDDLLSAPLHEGQTIMRLLGRHEDAKRLMELHHQVLRAITRGQPLRLADVISMDAVNEAIDMMIALIEKEVQGV